MKIKINKNNLICFLLIVPFIEPFLFKENPYIYIDKIYSISKIISFLLILMFTIRENTKIYKATFSR